MSVNGWLPHEYLDESMPPVRDTPDAWKCAAESRAER